MVTPRADLQVGREPGFQSLKRQSESLLPVIIQWESRMQGGEKPPSAGVVRNIDILTAGRRGKAVDIGIPQGAELVRGQAKRGERLVHFGLQPARSGGTVFRGRNLHRAVFGARFPPLFCPFVLSFASSPNPLQSSPPRAPTNKPFCG